MRQRQHPLIEQARAERVWNVGMAIAVFLGYFGIAQAVCAILGI